MDEHWGVPPNVLSIAGTDPSGGAGIQADLKAFSAHGAYGMSVITALVAQTTTGVREVHEVPPAFVTAQLDTLLEDVRVDAVKIGMLANAGVIHAVADALERHSMRRVVLDPVMVAKSGHRLLAADAVQALRERLIPLADLITPNLPEAADLLDEVETTDLDGMRAQARKLAALGTPRVLLKGGHLDSRQSVDVLYSVEDFAEPDVELLPALRVDTTNDHGTGCTLSASIAALVGGELPWPEAVSQAKAYLTDALLAANRLDVGHGRGPVHHHHRWW